MPELTLAEWETQFAEFRKGFVVWVSMTDIDAVLAANTKSPPGIILYTRHAYLMIVRHEYEDMAISLRNHYGSPYFRGQRGWIIARLDEFVTTRRDLIMLDL